MEKNSSSITSRQGSPKVLFSVIGTEFDPWKKVFLGGQCETWLKEVSVRHQIIYVTCKFFGPSIQKLSRMIEFLRWNAGRTVSYIVSYSLMITLFALRGKVPMTHEVERSSFQSIHNIKHIRINFPESLTSLRWKKISVINFFLQSDCDYLLFVNPSTYVAIGNLEAFLMSTKCREKETLYAGQVAHSADSLFVIGSFTLLNRNSAKLLLDGRWRIATHTLDDVAFGKFFSDCKVQEVEVPSMTITDVYAPHNLETKKTINFRLKIDSDNRALEEIQLMKSLYHNYGVR